MKEDQAKDLLASDGALNARRFAEDMAQAISSEIRPVSSGSLLASCLEPSFLASEPCYREGADWPEVVPAGLVSLLHGEWMRRIGEWLGFEDPEPDLKDGWYWVTDEMPATQAVARHLTRLHLEVLRTVTESFQAENGHTMVDVLLASAGSGEEFDQANARLHRQRVGLRRVK